MIKELIGWMSNDLTDEEVIALINTWSLQVGREPDNDEIRSIIHNQKLNKPI